MEQSKNNLQIRLNKAEENITIHRYMDYPKLLSLLTTNSIYFARPNEFEDKLDCVHPKYSQIYNDSIIQNAIKEECKRIAAKCIYELSEILKLNFNETLSREQIIITFQDLIFPLTLKYYNNSDITFYAIITAKIRKIANLFITKKAEETLNELTNFLYEIHKKYRIDNVSLNHNRVMVTCWQIGNHESDLMWKIYAKKDGILIQTNLQKLKMLNFDKYLKSGASCVIDKIKYIDLVKRNEYFNNLTLYTIDDPNQDILCHYFEKEKSFADEKELRVIIAEDYHNYNAFNNKPKGELIKIQIPICDFIEKIIISPYAPEYYAETLKNILNNSNNEDIRKLADKVELSKTKQAENIILLNKQNIR